jgi:hypothetical protein
MNIYLEKIASTEKKRDHIHGWTRTGTVVGTTAGAIALSTPINHGLVRAAHKGLAGNSAVTESDVNSYRKSKNLRHVIRGGNGMFDHELAAHYLPPGFRGVKRPTVNAKGADLAMHEYGHAHSFNKYRKAIGGKGVRGKFIMHSLSQRSALGLGALAGGYAATSDNEKVRKAAPYAVAASALPMLVEEAQASLSPAKHLLKTRGASVAKKFLKKMAPAYGTYLAATATGVGAASWAKHVKNKAIEKANK